MEDYLVVDVADLQTVRFVCTKCGAAVTMRAAEFRDLQTHCPGCGRQWVIGHGLIADAVRRLMQSLRDLAGPAEDHPIRVAFDVAASKGVTPR